VGIGALRYLPILTLPAALACREAGCIAVEPEAQLLEMPYPLGYPSTKPMPNRVLRTIAAGKHRYVNTVDGKDFRAFELRMEDGTRGYLIYGENVHDCPERDCALALGDPGSGRIGVSFHQASIRVTRRFHSNEGRLP
jgi:hypothetical protein